MSFVKNPKHVIGGVVCPEKLIGNVIAEVLIEMFLHFTGLVFFVFFTFHTAIDISPPECFLDGSTPIPILFTKSRCFCFPKDFAVVRYKKLYLEVYLALPTSK